MRAAFCWFNAQIIKKVNSNWSWMSAFWVGLIFESILRSAQFHITKALFNRKCIYSSYLQFISDINGALNAFNFCISCCTYCVCLEVYLFVWNLLSTETIIVLFNYPHSIIIINGVYLLQGEFFHVLWQIFSNDIWCTAIIIIFTID